MQQNIVIIGSCRSGHNFVREQIETWDKKNKYLIFNADDYNPIAGSPEDLNAKGIPIDIEKPTTAIVVIRGLLNWWASYVMWITDHGTRPISANNAFNIMQAWKGMVKARESKQLIGKDTLYIKYEDFTINLLTRRRTAMALGLDWDDGNVNNRSRQGRGSTFEGWLDVGNREDTQQRYKQITNSKVKSLFEDTLKARPDLIELYKHHWDPTKDELQYIEGHLAI